MSKEERLALIRAGREEGGKYQARAAIKKKKVPSLVSSDMYFIWSLDTMYDVASLIHFLCVLLSSSNSFGNKPCCFSINVRKAYNSHFFPSVCFLHHKVCLGKPQFKIV